MAVTFDTSLLLGYYQARNGQSASALATGSGGTKKYAPTAPWSPTSTAAKVTDLVKSALAGKRLINEGAAKLDLAGASEDYRKLFALHQGLASLQGLAERAGAKGVTDFELTRLRAVFERGLIEVAGYSDEAKFDQIRLTRGAVATSTKSAIGVPKNKYDYVTDKLHTGASTDVVPAFEGDAVFEIQVKKLAGTTTVAIDLADMGATPRTMSSVVNFINGKLQAQGYNTRFAVERTAGAPRSVIGSNGKPVTLPALGDDYAIRVKGDSSEQLTFSAVTKPAVYVTTYGGDPNPDKDLKTDDGKFENRLIKIDPSGATGPQTRIKTETLEGNILGVRQTRVGPDGSVYMLADVEKSVAGQAVKGEKDVALLKYDSAGNIVYARSLGAADKASGLGLAVSADGKIAVSGAVTGTLMGATNGPINSSDASGKSDSFISLYNAKGDEVWTVRRGSLEADEAGAVAFGDDGTVYVTGRAKSTMPGSDGAVGAYDGYLSAIATTDKGAARVLFTEQFGTVGDDKPAGIVVDGDKVIVAGLENGEGVLRTFDTVRTETRTIKTVASGVLTHTIETYVGGVLTDSQSTNYGAIAAPDSTTTTSFTSAATASAGATRSIGDLQGGAIAGLSLDGGQLYIAGHTRNASLSLGSPTNGHAGGIDAFAASLSTDLSSTAADKLAYYGGAGDNTVTGMSVAAGQVWLVGAAGADLPGLTAQGTKEGYVAALDTATGAVSGAQRLSGKDGIATATSIAVDTSGASTLDRFGLPKGVLNYEASQKITSATAARAGDTFQIRTREGGTPVTVTLAAGDTLETLAAMIRRKAGSAAKVEVVSNGATRVLKISPASDNAVVEIMPGKGGKDLLEAIGLTEGIVRRTEFVDGKTVSTAPGGEVYGLALDVGINLDTKEDAMHAAAVIAAALGKIRTAYKDLENLAKPKSLTQTNASANGPVPAYLSAQIANYQAGLARLTGGG